MLQAQYILYIMIDEGFVAEDVKRGLWDKEHSALTRLGGHFYEEFAKSRSILHTQIPPEACIGSPWVHPLVWVSNTLGEWSTIDVYSAREAVEAILFLMVEKGQDAGMLE